jgi:hypothetical protein
LGQVPSDAENATPRLLLIFRTGTCAAIRQLRVAPHVEQSTCACVFVEEIVAKHEKKAVRRISGLYTEG